MSDVTAAGTEAALPASGSDNGPLSIQDAVAIMARNREEDSGVEREAETRDPPQRSAKAEAAPQEDTESSGEEIEADDAAHDDEPPVEAPRSWSKEDKEAFKSLPREVQERISAREAERDRSIRTRQNELAEREKALRADSEKAAQTRQQYEQALPALVQTLQAAQAAEFSDIRTFDDVERMAAEDPARFVRFQAAQAKIQRAYAEMSQAQQRQVQEQAQQFEKFVVENDRLFIEKNPDLKDAKVYEKATKAAVSYLTDTLEFSADELRDLWNGKTRVSLRDARIQTMIREAAQYRELKAQVAKPTNVPPPKVMKPSTQATRSEAADDRIRALDNRLSKTGTLRDAFEYWQAVKGTGKG